MPNFHAAKVAAVAIALCGCSAPQIMKLEAGPGQEAIVRNGVPSLISTKKHVVMIRPNSRQIAGHSRPAFTIAVRNQSNKQETLTESSIRALQIVGNKTVAIRVFSYDELVQEETDRQTVAAIGVALGAVGGAMQAANAGYVTTTGSVRTPYGSSTYVAQTYDPLRAQIAQNANTARTQADIENLRMTGEQNLAALENTILKDNTVMPGEWYGGTVVLAPPEEGANGGKSYSISVTFGGEEHTFAIAQVPRS